MDHSAPARVFVVGDKEPAFQRELEVGLRNARTWSRLSLDDYAATLGATLGRPVTPVMVTDWETGRLAAEAVVLIAAARLADQPVSALLGEMESIPGVFEMERQVSDLTAIVTELQQNKGSH